jgi:hypothetical protein
MTSAVRAKMKVAVRGPPAKMKLAVREFERPDRGFTYELRKWRSLIAKTGPDMRKNGEKSR